MGLDSSTHNWSSMNWSMNNLKDCNSLCWKEGVDNIAAPAHQQVSVLGAVVPPCDVQLLFSFPRKKTRIDSIEKQSTFFFVLWDGGLARIHMKGLSVSASP
jgi:hypothetical protein